MIQFEIPVPPSTNNLYINAAHGGRVKAPAYRRWLEAAGWEVRAQVKGKALTGKWQLTIRANIRSVRDISNVIKPIEDLAVSLKIVPDDRHCRKVTAIRDGSLPAGRALVVIEEAEA